LLVNQNVLAFQAVFLFQRSVSLEGRVELWINQCYRPDVYFCTSDLYVGMQSPVQWDLLMGPSGDDQVMRMESSWMGLVSYSEVLRAALSLLLCKYAGRRSHLQARKWALTRTKLACIFVIDFQSFGTVRNTFLLFISYSVCGILLKWFKCIKINSHFRRRAILGCLKSQGVGVHVILCSKTKWAAQMWVLFVIHFGFHLVGMQKCSDNLWDYAYFYIKNQSYYQIYKVSRILYFLEFSVNFHL
jgi:hypothetical protein